MNLSICTISFRHHLVSLAQIAHWAARHKFQGIEIWGVHAKNLGLQAETNRDWLWSIDLKVSMISDYLPLAGDAPTAWEKTRHLAKLAELWGTNKLRTFAGDKSSNAVPKEERQKWIVRLRELCKVAAEQGVCLVIETHPNTLADTLDSTLQLIEEVDHPALRINFDVIHIWESGTDPLRAFRVLEPLILHMHLKNISSSEKLACFTPANVYAPAGSRDGMVGVFEGAFDYQRFLTQVMTGSLSIFERLDASLEWFGPDVFSTLERDCRELSDFTSQFIKRTPEAVATLA